MTVVVAAPGYPGTPRTGDPVGGLAEAGAGLEDDGFKLVMTSSDTTTHVNNDFGNWQQGTKSGVKFQDNNADGSKTGDPLLDGWTIRVYNDNDNSNDNGNSNDPNTICSPRRPKRSARVPMRGANMN